LLDDVVKLEETDDRNSSKATFMGVMRQGKDGCDKKFEPRRKSDVLSPDRTGIRRDTKTVFSTKQGHWEYLRLSVGLKRDPATFK
jgi:hypothetical protein